MNRRRAMQLLGATTLAGAGGCQRKNPLLRFDTIAFGTDVYFQLHGTSQADFEKISSACSERLRELESIFSLYDKESAISRLNQDGELRNAPRELIDLVKYALSLGEQTNGLFDITVQPLWNWRYKWKQADRETRQTMETESWQQCLELVGYQKVSVNDSTIAFQQHGMAITLNGIAQGYATEQITNLLSKHGVKHALVNIGEYAAIGTNRDGKPWKVELAASGDEVQIPNGKALAVSSGSGYIFDPEGRYHHIFQPSNGTNTRPEKTVTAIAPSATLADALATTFTVATPAEQNELREKFPQVVFREIS